MKQKKILDAIIAGIILLSASQVIARASDSISSSNNANSSKAKSSPLWISLPKKTLGVVTGVIVGVPVCLVRKPIDEEKYGIAQMNGDNHQPRVAIPAAVFWAPFAVMTGVLEAPFDAITNSLANINKPFSKKQLSLIDTPIETETEPYSAPH